MLKTRVAASVKFYFIPRLELDTTRSEFMWSWLGFRGWVTWYEL